MRAAIYNRYWQSMGGGERYAAMVAATLAHDGCSVDLLSPVDVDLDAIASHLSVDLTGVGLRVVRDDDESRVARASEDYDLFVNSTYMSDLRPRSTRSAYICSFPTPRDHELSDRQRRWAHRLGPRIAAPPQIRNFGHGTGWYPPEGGVRTKWSWSNGDGRLELPHGGKETFELGLGRPGMSGQVRVQVTDGDGNPLATISVGQEFRAWTVTVPPSTRRRELRVQSDTITPAGDNRALGVALRRGGGLTDLTLSGLVVRRMPWLLLGRETDTSFVESYDALVTNSKYTSLWVRRLWGVESDLLYPPIDVAKMAPEPVRDKTIITIGRFFDPVRGHGKRQLEMVDIFRDALRRPELDGWTLHMVGGCEEANRPYFEKVMAASEGLPVELHPNAPRRVLNRLINRASIFWSATGMNEDTETRPWRNEHFGMTTAEAMAAGCVPVVIDRAGQQEIVREGVDGYRWETADQAVARTAEVAGDPELRARMAASSIVRAADFSDDAFAARWREICVKRGLLDARDGSSTAV